MIDLNSCYCTNHSICTICARGYSSSDPVFYADTHTERMWADMERQAYDYGFDEN